MKTYIVAIKYKSSFKKFAPKSNKRIKVNENIYHIPNGAYFQNQKQAEHFADSMKNVASKCLVIKLKN